MKAKPETRLLFVIVLAAAIYALSLINFSSEKVPVINKEVTEKNLHEAEKEILKFASNIGSIAVQANNTKSLYDYHNKFEKSWRNKGYYFLIYKNDSLYYWTDSRISFGNITPNVIEDYAVLKLRNGWYETFNKNFNGTSVISFLLLKNDYVYQNRFLHNRFNPALNVLPNAEFKTSPSGNSININSGNGKYLFSVSAPATPGTGILSSPEIINKILLYLFFVLIIYIFYYTGNIIFAKKKNTLLKLLYPLILLALVFFLVILKIPLSLFELELFSSQLYASSLMLSSLGAFVLISFTVFISGSYYFKVFRHQIQHGSLAMGILLIFLFYILLIIVNNLIFGLIINSSISFDITNLFSLSIYSLIGFISISALLFTLYLAGQAVVDNFFRKSLKHFLFSLFILTFTFVLIHFLFKKSDIFSNVSVEIFIWAFIFLLSVFYLSKKENLLFEFSLFLPVIILLSALTGFIIFKFNKEKEQNNRVVLAQRLERERDYVAEHLFEDIARNINNDRLLSGLMANPFQNAEAIERRINQLYFSGYWNKYERNIFIFDSLATLYYNPTNEAVSLQSFRQLIDNRGVSASTDLFFLNEESGRPRYIAFLPVTFPSGNFAGTIVVDMEARLIQEQAGFPELLLSSAVITSTDIANYSYARYNNGRLLLQHGEYAYTLYHARRGDRVENYRFVDRDKFNHLVYRSGPDSVILLTKRKETWLDYITMFSYMFALFSLFTLFYGSFHLIPYRFSLGDLTFRRRIQQSMTWLVIISLVLIGAGTVIYIIKRNNIQKREQITSRLNSALVSIESELVKNGRIGELTEEIVIKLTQISTLMYTDFHIYDITGSLIYSTQPKLFEQGLISGKIEPTAFVELALNNNSRVIQNEEIGNLKFLSAYAPLRNEFSQTIGFLNLPYFARESELRNEISAFLVALVNVYLLLLVLAIIIAVLVANRLTTPLNLIRQKIAHTKLGKPNEYLEWNRNDEIGELVYEYNKMVDQLAESAELLAKSERELAWREMAKQVAHEIKNPLTPMKLSVQHLERIWKDDTKNKEEKIRKLTQTLIQQIDTLSAIATEFSNFAKLPKPQLEEVNLVELLEGITNLYGQENIEIVFSSDTTDAIILADKDQLLRVFNNITKNAIQAIPETKKGLIKINLTQSEDIYLISIQDNGEGIEIDQQSRIFQPNFTTKSGGTGLGLSMVKNILTSMGGEIWFESEQGTGTTFFVKLSKGHFPVHS